MRVSKIVLAGLFCLLIMQQSAYAQRSNKVTKSRYNYSVPKVRGNQAKIICPVFMNSKYPFHGLGVKFGDPFSLTYKYYANKKLAIVLDAGKAASGLYNTYFQEKFGTYLVRDTLPSSESRITYLTHRVKSDLVLEAKLLYHIDATKISEGLQFYAGAGWEWKRTELRYDYQYSSDVMDPAAEPFDTFTRRRVAMGPQIVAGIEYSYFSIPISAFMEAEYFTDIQADPGWSRFEGGVGLRYIF